MVHERVGTSEWEDGRGSATRGRRETRFRTVRAMSVAQRGGGLAGAAQDHRESRAGGGQCRVRPHGLKEYYAKTGALVAACGEGEAFLEASKNFDIRNDQSGEKAVPPNP